MISWKMVNEVTVEKCGTCGHELKGSFYVLRKLENRYEPYIESNLADNMARREGMARPEAACEQCGKLCDSTKLTKVDNKSKLLCPTCQERLVRQERRN